MRGGAVSRRKRFMRSKRSSRAITRSSRRWSGRLPEMNRRRPIPNSLSYGATWTASRSKSASLPCFGGRTLVHCPSRRTRPRISSISVASYSRTRAMAGSRCRAVASRLRGASPSSQSTAHGTTVTTGYVSIEQSITRTIGCRSSRRTRLPQPPLTLTTETVRWIGLLHLLWQTKRSPTASATRGSACAAMTRDRTASTRVIRMGTRSSRFVAGLDSTSAPHVGGSSIRTRSGSSAATPSRGCSRSPIHTARRRIPGHSPRYSSRWLRNGETRSVFRVPPSRGLAHEVKHWDRLPQRQLVLLAEGEAGVGCSHRRCYCITERLHREHVSIKPVASLRELDSFQRKRREKVHFQRVFPVMRCNGATRQLHAGLERRARHLRRHLADDRSEIELDRALGE